MLILHPNRAYEGATHGHKQGCGDTLAADIANDQRNVVIVDAEEVVEIATDVLCRLHRGIDVQQIAVLREWREDARQDKLLDLVGSSQVFLQSLQLLLCLLRCMYEVNLLDGLLDGTGQVIHVDRFRGEIEGTAVHGQTDVLQVTVGTHHDDAQGGVLHLVDFGQHLQTVHHRHVDVAEDNLDVRMLLQYFETLHTVMGKEELIFATTNLPSEELLHQKFDLFLVIDT